MYSTHEKSVQEIARAVSSFHKRGVPFRVYHGSTNSTRVTTFDKNKMVDVSQLNHVISVDKKAKTIIVESNVPMDALVDSTLKYGLIPPVVMEFPGITVGGGVQGGAGESSSYKWGTFNRIVNWYEMVLGNGEIIRVSPQKNSDLYWGAVGSYGTLGVITAVEIQLISAKEYISLEYIPVHSFKDAVQTLKKEIKRNPDYIDGIMFSLDLGVIMVGNMSGKIEESLERRFTRAKDEWFYLHAQKLAKSGLRITEQVPLKDYLFRYDRGAFWMGKHAFQRFKTPFNRFTRWLLNPLLRTRNMYAALQASGVSQEHIIQDLALPEETAVDFIEYIDHRFTIYPLWICPLLVEKKSPLLSSYLDTKLVINIGVWGQFEGNYQQFIDANRELEDEVEKLGGKKWLYAHTFYSEEKFWQIYNGKKKYDSLRKKYHAETLPTVYEKVRMSKRQKVNSKKGVLFALLGISGIKVH